MAELKSLTCPTCSAPLTITGSDAEVRCQYCGNMVFVPPEMRAPAPEDAEAEQIDNKVANTMAAITTATRPSNRGCLLVFILVIVGGPLLVTAGVIYITTQGASAIASAVSSNFAPIVALASAVPARDSGVSLAATFGGDGTGAGLFSDPTNLAVDGKGYVYVSDRDTGLIQRFDPSGNYLSRWQADPKAKYGPNCLVADHSGNVFVCGNSGLLKFDGATGKLLGTFRGEQTDSHQDFFRSGAAALLDGSLLVYESGNDQLVKLGPTGQILYRAADTISSHLGKDKTTFNVQIGVDGLGNSYVLEEITNYILQYKPDGTFVNRFGGQGGGQDQFQNADAIAVDSRSQIYILDGWAEAIKDLDRDGHYLKSYPLPSAANRISARGMGFDDAGDLYILGNDKKIYKLQFAANR